VLRDSVDAFDRFVDGLVAPLRGRQVVDTTAYAASALGDHGLVWFLAGVARGALSGRRRAAAIRAVAFTGVVAPVVNAALKSAVGRRRPTQESPHPMPVRIPRTASFPSGHSLAAWCAATLLADDDPLAPAYYAMAGAVSFSRVHVRLHHATDVVAGSILGIALGRLGRALLPLGGRIMRRLECRGRGRG
jgi:membrane-associated phospholipid phosphatase